MDLTMIGFGGVFLQVTYVVCVFWAVGRAKGVARPQHLQASFIMFRFSLICPDLIVVAVAGAGINPAGLLGRPGQPNEMVAALDLLGRGPLALAILFALLSLRLRPGPEAEGE